MRSTLRLAIVQTVNRHYTSFDDFATTMDALLARVADAELVVLPEVVTAGLLWIGFGDAREPSAAEIADLAAQYEDYFSTHAGRTGQSVLAGSHVEVVDGGVYNTAFLFHPDGWVDKHSKTHGFPTEQASGSREGETLEVFDVGGVVVGMPICYEMEFPEVATVLARKGADVLLVPAYNHTEAAFYRVRRTSASRAIENQVFVAHVGAYGAADAPIGPGWARSAVFTPCDDGFPADGVLGEVAENAEDVLVVDLDLDALRAVRAHGAATIVKDRTRRMPLYRRYAPELLGLPAST